MSTKGRRPAPLSITTLTEQERIAAVDARWMNTAKFHKTRFMGLAVHDHLVRQQRESVFTAALLEEYGMTDDPELDRDLLPSLAAVLTACQ
jgi:hypothetical protein